MKDLISIIIPVYNVENYINACMKSVIEQSYDVLDIILVDDGSTDNSGDICDYYEKKDERITVIHKMNGGLSDARNCGIKKAQGKYITFVDSDDIIAHDYIEKLYTMIKNSQADISICDCVHIFPDTSFTFKKATIEEKMKPEQAIKKMLYQKQILVSAWAKLYKISLFSDVIFPVGMLYEDSAIMYKIFEKTNLIVYSNAKMYGYYHRENSITTQKFDVRNFDIMHIAEKIYMHYKNNSYLLGAARSYYVVACLRIYLNCPNDKKYKEILKKIRKNINIYGIRVLLDNDARKKTRLGIACYYFARPFIRVVYRKVDRWS